MIKKILMTSLATAVTSSIIIKHRLASSVAEEAIIDVAIVAIHVAIVAKINRKS